VLRHLGGVSRHLLRTLTLAKAAIFARLPGERGGTFFNFDVLWCQDQHPTSRVARVVDPIISSLERGRCPARGRLCGSLAMADYRVAADDVFIVDLVSLDLRCATADRVVFSMFSMLSTLPGFQSHDNTLFVYDS